VSTAPLCASPSCAARGKHQSDCGSEDCRGCLPRRAADGLRLCVLHTDLIAEDARSVAELHAALADRLASSGLPGERTSGTRDPGLKLNDAAVEARVLIRHTLVSWTYLIAEERGVALPVDTTAAVAAFVARHAPWLAAHSEAGSVSDELRDLVRHAYPIAYPSGTRIFDVAGCPTEGCAGTLRAILRRTDSLLPTAVSCDADDTHSWPADKWLTLGRQIRKGGTA